MSHTLSSHLPLRQSQRHSRRNSPYLGRRRRADEVTAVSAPSLLPTAQPLREEISNSLESRRGPVGGEELGWRLGLGGRRSSSMAGGAEKGCEAAARREGLRGGGSRRWAARRRHRSSEGKLGPSFGIGAGYGVGDGVGLIGGAGPRSADGAVGRVRRVKRIYNF